MLLVTFKFVEHGVMELPETLQYSSTPALVHHPAVFFCVDCAAQIEKDR